MLTNDIDDNAVQEALKALWYAAKLYRSGVIPLPGDENLTQQRELFRQLSESLLGDKAMEFEVHT